MAAAKTPRNRPKKKQELISEDTKENLKRKIRFFVNRRNDFIILILAIAYYNNSSTLDDALALVSQKDGQISTLSSYTTYITDNGVIKQYEKEKFDVFKEKLNVANVLSKYLVKSAFILTDKYTVTFFQDEKILYKQTPSFVEFKTNFIDINANVSTEEGRNGYTKVNKDWEQILRWFQAAINGNDLPHILDKKESDINIQTWETDKNKFSITFTIPAYANSRNKHNAIDKGIAEARIKATGYYDLQQKSSVNSYGMKFTSLDLVHPKINQKLMKSE